MTNQIELWNGPQGEKWAREQAERDEMIRPFGLAALEAAAPAPGEAVVDVGCGCGDTTVALAERVGPKGRVVAVDVSAPMLARARERCAGRSNVTLIEEDAGRAELARGAFDLVFSRFGVMFFSDPKAAFANLRGALRPKGRVAFVCWRPLAENEWATVPAKAVVSIVGAPPPQPPDAPGPFSLGDRARLRSVLEGAGFADVVLRAHDGAMHFSPASSSPEEIARAVTRSGPVARLLIDKDEATLARAVAAIAEVVRPRVAPGGGVALGAATWIVTATNPG